MIEVSHGDITRTHGGGNVEITIDETGNVHVRGVGFDVVGGSSEEVEIVQAIAIFIRAPKTDENEEDQGSDGTSHGREDARKPSQFSHDGVRLSKVRQG